MNPQFKKGVLELCVLATVRDKDRYGYELVENISQHIEISEGTIYPLLRRLTKDGYFETYLKESAEGPPRKYYSLSAKEKRSPKTSPANGTILLAALMRSSKTKTHWYIPDRIFRSTP